MNYICELFMTGREYERVLVLVYVPSKDRLHNRAPVMTGRECIVFVPSTYGQKILQGLALVSVR